MATWLSNRVNSPNLYNPEVSRKPSFKSHPPLWWTYNMTVPGWRVKTCCMRHRGVLAPDIFSQCPSKLHANTWIATKQQNQQCKCVCLSEMWGGLGWGGSFRKRNFICLNCKERNSVQSKITPNKRFKFFFCFSSFPLPNSFFYIVCLSLSLLMFPNLRGSPNFLY